MTKILDIMTQAEATEVRGLKLVVPDLLQCPEFRHYINTTPVTATRDQGESLTQDDYCDVVVYVDPTLSGEGSDSDMPGWELIVDKLRSRFGQGPFSGDHFVVVLSNS